MRRALLAAAYIAVLALTVSSVADAHGGGGHGGGGHGGGGHSGGGHGGGGHFSAPHGGNFSGGHFGNNFRGRPVLVPHFRGAPIRTPFVHRPFIQRRFFIAGAPLIVLSPVYAPAPYVQPQGYWYYCAELDAYYPDVSECPGPWQPIPQ